MSSSFKRECDGKRAYESDKAARRIAREQSRREGQPIRPYSCSHCHAFHIGHSLRSTRAVMKRAIREGTEVRLPPPGPPPLVEASE